MQEAVSVSWKPGCSPPCLYPPGCRVEAGSPLFGFTSPPRQTVRAVFILRIQARIRLSFSFRRKLSHIPKNFVLLGVDQILFSDQPIHCAPTVGIVIFLALTSLVAIESTTKIDFNLPAGDFHVGYSLYAKIVQSSSQ